MAMNREQRRYLQRQGQMDSDGNPIATRRDNRPVRSERVTPLEYIREVRAELGRVMWPTRREVINYTIVVVVTLIIVTGLVALLDYLFAEGLISLLDAGNGSSTDAG
ncbi:MAG: preprotein translocase subunit SecE [Actinomycetota bacterium]